jgi:hypothetical protein
MVEVARANSNPDYDYMEAFSISDWGAYKNVTSSAPDKEILKGAMFYAGKKLFQKKHGHAITDAEFNKLHTNWCEDKIAKYVRANKDCWEDDIYEWESAAGKKMTDADQIRIAGRTFKIRTAAEERAKEKRAGKRARIAGILSPFAIVERGSSEGSTFIFGAVVAIIGFSVGSAIFGWIAGIVAAIVGWVIGSQVIGESVHVYLGKLILYFVILSVLAIGGLFLFSFMKSSGPGSLFAKTQISAAADAADATIAANVNFRKGPSTDNDIIRQLQQGDTVTLTGETSGGWTQITHNGDTGWISSEFIIK